MRFAGNKKFIGLLIALIFLNTGYKDKAIAFDTTAPKVESCKINVKSIPSTGGEVTVTAQIKSAFELDRTPVIRMFNNGYERWIADVKFAELTSGDMKSGTWTSTFSVLTDRKPDRYFVFFDALWDKGGNSNKMSFRCEEAYVDYGGYVMPTPTPTPTQKTSPPPSNESGVNSEVLKLKSLVDVLQGQVKTLQIKMKKICSAKPKPKGC